MGKVDDQQRAGHRERGVLTLSRTGNRDRVRFNNPSNAWTSTMSESMIAGSEKLLAS